MIDNCRDDNDDADGDIYNNENVPDHEYSVKNGSLAGMRKSKGEYPVLNEGLNIWTHEGRNAAPTMMAMITTI